MARSTSTLLVLLFVGIALCAAPVHADGLNVVDEYNVSGLLTITGSGACPPAPACAETLGFSFLIGSVYNPTYDTDPFEAYVVPNLGTFESLGPLGQFSSISGPDSLFPAGECGPEGDCDYIGIFDQWGDEIDLHLAEGLSDAPIVPDVVAADLFTCGQNMAQTCFQDFYPVQFVFGEVEATVTPVTTPEPSTLLMLGTGLFALALLRSRQKWFPIVSTRNCR
ncbi:MAG: PEP-CTERM sorting domain-containing protein [Candidatus Acidiferrales bacterium]